jgi:hypothetical protein
VSLSNTVQFVALWCSRAIVMVISLSGEVAAAIVMSSSTAKAETQDATLLPAGAMKLTNASAPSPGQETAKLGKCSSVKPCVLASAFFG